MGHPDSGLRGADGGQDRGAGGVLLIGLGCEENQLAALLDRIPTEQRTRIRSVGAQISADEYGEAAAAIDELLELAAQDRRETVGLGALRPGLKCGGSDGFSGLTANPLIGRVADGVTQAGGQAILTEIPEMFGAERLLMQRSADEAVFEAQVAMINRFKRYFLDHGEPISEIPAPAMSRVASSRWRKNRWARCRRAAMRR